MKKTLVLLVVSFLLSASLYSQVIQYEIKVKYNHEASGTSADINITVKAGNPEFTFFLMTNDPKVGEVLQKSEPTKRKNYVFKEVKPGMYFVKIEDNKGLPAGNTIEIKETEDSSN
jgi:hypothetical protein